MGDKTYIVTGGNAGIGKAIALSLAKMNLHVVIVSRNAEKGQSALDEIKSASGNKSVEMLQGSLDSIENTKKLASALNERFPTISVLINNAGVWMTEKIITSDGLEYTFMVNHMAPFILSNLLLDTLKRNAPSRIVNVNAGLYVFGKIDLSGTPYGKDFSRTRTYMNTKLCNVLFTREFAKLIEGSGVTINALHPGVINTGLGNRSGFMGSVLRLVKKAWAAPEKGAQAPVWVATAPELEKVNGKFFNVKKEMAYTENAQDDVKSKELYELSLRLAGISK